MWTQAQREGVAKGVYAILQGTYQLDNSHFFLSAKGYLFFLPYLKAKIIASLCLSFKCIQHKITYFTARSTTLFCLRIQWPGGLLILKKNFDGCLKKFVVMLKLF